MYALTSNGTRRLEYGYDSLGRLQNTTLHNDYTDFYTLYTYHNTRDGGTTGRVKTIEYRGTNGVRNNDTLTYYYNANGQITSETDSSGKEHSYSYDPLGRLYREDDAKAGTTTAYNYDDRGNIAQKRVYAYTTGILANGTLRDTITYTYGNAVWKDLLTAYDGERITYDAIGNPLSYRNGMTFTWQAGRQMKTATVGNLTYTMQYNQDGIRTGKVQSAGSTTGEETVYYIEDGEILGEYRYNAGVKKLLYQFDANGRRIGFTYNGTQYYYRHNLQGDVIAIVDRNADTVAKYTYDAWGKVLSVTNASGVVQTNASFIGNINPIRYRGYYYDTDLGLYYLQSRYYDPETGRFVNGDAINMDTKQDNIHINNLYAYCYNDPVNNEDPTGYVVGVDDLAIITVVGLTMLVSTAVAVIAANADTSGMTSVDPTQFVKNKIVSLFIIPAAIVSSSSTAAGKASDFYSQSRSSSKAKSKSVPNSIAQSRTEQKAYQYWKTYFIGKHLVIGMGITYMEAKMEILNGHNIMCANQQAAFSVLFNLGYRNMVGPEKSGGSDHRFYWHYHPNRSSPVHVWYYS